MLRLAVVFFLLAFIAAILGFGGLASSFAGAAEISFYVFLALFVLSVVVNIFYRKNPA